MVTLLPLPPLRREENGKKKAKFMGQDKGSLTEQQTKGTLTMTILIRRIYKTNSESVQSNSHCPVPHVFPRRDYLSPGQLPSPEPIMAAHGTKYPVLFGQVGSACPAVSPPSFL